MTKETDLVPWGWAAYGWMGTIWKTYKLTHEGWRKLYERQEGKCPGCGKVLAHPLEKDMTRFGLKPQVDHRHRKDAYGNDLQCDTEDVRGLLCAPCNRLLGVVRDNKTLMENLVAYLKQHGDY